MRPTDERLHCPGATPRLVHQTGLQQWLVCCAAQWLHYQQQDELVNPRDARGEQLVVELRRLAQYGLALVRRMLWWLVLVVQLELESEWCPSAH